MTAQQNRARMQFLTWVRTNFPDLYSEAIAQAEGMTENAKLAGLGEDEQPSFWQKVAGGLTSLGTTYLTLKNQRDAMKLNLERAQQGLPPVDAGVTAPVVRTEIDLPPDVVNKLTAGAGTQVNKVLLFAAVAAGAVWLMQRRR